MPPTYNMDSGKDLEVDRMMSVQARRVQTTVIVAGYLGLAHFVIGLLLTLRVMVGSDAPVGYLFYSLPFIGITVAFLSTVILGHFRQLRWSALTLFVGLLASVAVFVYDFQNHRYQISGTGHGPTYTMWWWYYEPYWQGYEPGNL